MARGLAGRLERLHATNNFPEFTGRLCPAPCETACVLGINQDPVTIKQVEVEIVDRAWDEGWVTPQPAPRQSGRTVAVVGSGPAGLAAAQQLTRAGHTVAVFERADRIGGLLRYGIPEFKMEKRHLDRRIAQMRGRGHAVPRRRRRRHRRHRTRPAPALRRRRARGRRHRARELAVPGRELAGVHQAMEYLPGRTGCRRATCAGRRSTSRGKHVVIIGGGDTGADCLGTAHRQGAASVTQLEILPQPPRAAAGRPAVADVPDDLPGVAARTRRAASGSTRCRRQAFLGDEDGRVAALLLQDVELVDGGSQPVEGSTREIPCDYVFLAMGFTGPEQGPLLEQLGVELDERGNVARDDVVQTNVAGVFVAGDAGRGQSLIVWAIAEGRSAAAAVDRWLTGSTTLPAPIPPTARQLTV